MQRTLTSGPLSRPAARRVYEAIEAHPGLSMSELARRLEIYWTSLALQVERLTRAGLVRTMKVGRRRVLFVTDATDQIPRDPRFALLAEPSSRRVAQAIVARPGSRIPDLCDRLSMSERAVYHHLKRLLDARLIVTESRAGYRGLHAAPMLVAWLATSEPPAEEPSE